jgi:hypothetical protein
VLAQLKSTKREVPTLFYELARLCLTFKNTPKMETTAVMLLNSLMEEKDKSSINYKCVSIALLKRCTFSGSEVVNLLAPHSNLLLDIIENESDLSLRMLSAEVLPKITSSQGLPQVLNQMKSRILSLGNSEDDQLISKILSNNLLQLLHQKSSDDSLRLSESLELLLLIRNNIDQKHLFSIINMVCKKPELQDSAVQLVLDSLPKGHGMPGFCLVAWYLLGEFGSSLFTSKSAHFPEFLKLLEKAPSSSKSLRLIIISAVAKLWARAENTSQNSHHFGSFKSTANQVFRKFMTDSDLETQSRASQFVFLLQSTHLSSENKLEIFSNIPCSIQSQQFDVEAESPGLMQASSLQENDFLNLEFNNAPAPTSDPLDLFNTPNEEAQQKQPKNSDPGLDLFMNSPMEVKTESKKSDNLQIGDPGLDLFGPPPSTQKTNPDADLDLLSLGVNINQPPTQSGNNQPKKDNTDFDLELI